MSRKTMIPIGTRFGRLVVTGEATPRDCGLRRSGKYYYRRIRTFYNCLCDCGNTKYVEECHLRNGDVRSCGCLKRDFYESLRRHNTRRGDRNTPLHSVWEGMIRRCHKENAPNYRIYGGRGISVCQQWREDFGMFREWSNKNGYARGLQLDRIDVNGNYCPENCRWVTPRQNAHNRRNNIFIDYHGERRKLVDVIDEKGTTIDTRTICKRINQHGWDIDRALTEPKHYTSRRRIPRLTLGGKEISIRQLADLAGMSVSGARHRLLDGGMSIEQIISAPKVTHRNSHTSPVHAVRAGRGCRGVRHGARHGRLRKHGGVRL